MQLTDIPVGDNFPKEMNVIIEIPMNGLPVKYEVHKSSGALFVDRFLNTAMYYPCNYGYVPQTLAEDGDPVDVLVVAPCALISGCVVPCRAIGMLQMQDEKGIDTKILAVPLSSVTMIYDQIKNIEDMQKNILDQIVHFFEHYKDLEPNKWVKLEKWHGVEAARKDLLACQERYKAQS